MEKLAFKENQRYRRKEVFVAVLFFIVVISYRFINQTFINPQIESTIPLSLFLLILLGLALVFAYYSSIRLITVINEKGIRYQYFPWHYKKQKICWDEVKSLEVIETSLVAELSGWAVNFNSLGQYFCVGRQRGILITLKTDKQIFIGTKDPKALKDTIDKLSHKL